MLENDQLALIPIKLLEVFLYFQVLRSLNKKKRGVPFLNRPTLHQFFVLGIAGWIFYMFFDTIIYIIAPLSIPSSLEGDFEFYGYQSGYPSVFWANILRDIGILGALMMAWFYCAAAVKIHKGINLHQKIFLNQTSAGIFSNTRITWGKINTFLGFLLLGLIVAFDRIAVHVIEGTKVHVTSKTGIGSILITIFFSVASILMLMQMIYLNHADMDHVSKQRARRLGYGIVLFTCGLYYWMVTGLIINLLINRFPQIENFSLGFLIFGHLIWTLSAFFVYLGFKNVNQSEEKK